MSKRQIQLRVEAVAGEQASQPERAARELAAKMVRWPQRAPASPTEQQEERNGERRTTK